jgi:hypothetical protein
LLAFAQQEHAQEAGGTGGGGSDGGHNAQRGGWKRAYRE